MTASFILASTSPFRRDMLANAGLDFDIVRPEIDERVVEESVEGSGLAPTDIASLLAEAKAVDVSERHPGRMVIGCDQILALDEEVLHKPENMEAARRRLLALSGKTHELHSAIVAARDGAALWRHVSTARMTVRKLDPVFVGQHLARVGDKALSSVGAYQVEGVGIQLFDRIEGSHFTIVGLPLLPLLAFLREQGVIDA